VDVFELIPAIDLKQGKCVRLRGGDMNQTTEYSNDPLAMALHWQEQGASRLHLVDLDGAFAGESRHLAAAHAIFRRLKIPVQFGGGLRSLEQVDRVLGLGADRAILGTAAVESPELVRTAVRRHPGTIVVGIDARQGRVARRGWAEQGTEFAADLARQMMELGVERFVYTDIARDGMLVGVNIDQTARLARACGARIIASGGVASVADVRALWERREEGIEGVILGRALYDKKIDFAGLRAELAGWSAHAG
jgi:phosphoribosylformimino-5-aminoimidazole carboxamide ribotide isomerase